MSDDNREQAETPIDGEEFDKAGMNVEDSEGNASESIDMENGGIESSGIESSGIESSGIEGSGIEGSGIAGVGIENRRMESRNMEGSKMESDVAVNSGKATAETVTHERKGEAGQGPRLNSRISSEVNLDTLLKVPVSLSIEVGRTRMPLSQVLDTREGTVIELERLLDEPLDILVNGALIAHGVVVMANDRFGIQITDIVSPQERVRHV